jgi:DNA-binding NtrC family response regulator
MLAYCLRRLRTQIPMSLCRRCGRVAKTFRRFVGIYAHRMNKQIDHIAPETMSELTSYQWPGNIREAAEFYRAQDNP